MIVTVCVTVTAELIGDKEADTSTHGTGYEPLDKGTFINSAMHESLLSTRHLMEMKLEININEMFLTDLETFRSMVHISHCSAGLFHCVEWFRKHSPWIHIALDV